MEQEECNVKVVLRVRPLVARERLAGALEALHLVPGCPQVTAGSDHSYTFDQVFGTEVGQSGVFEESAAPVLDAFLEGFNCTILAYGQTGSGKTFTMGTGLDGALDASTSGIIPRAVEYIEAKLAGSDDLEPCELWVSFLEIYNEEIIDLLNQAQQQDCRTRKGILAVREDAQGGIFVTGIKEEQCKDATGVLECLRNGSLCRTTKSTQMNLVSSRSHAILTLSLRRRLADGRKVTVKLHFVDLAGSERLKRTNAQGDRAKESISINGGLLALGNVISALGDTSKKATHVPYRDSKLTRLLQDSLGGNSKTLMIACVSPSSDNLVETLNTLKYANRARNIKNRVQLAPDAEGDAAFEVIQLKKQVAALKQQLNQIRTAPQREKNTTIPDSKLKRECEDLKRRLEVMTREKRLVEQERDALKREFNADPTRSPKTKEYLKTISELRGRLVHVEASAKEKETPTARKGLSRPVRPTKAVTSPKVETVEPGTPNWLHAVDDLLGRAKSEIEQAYDGMDTVMEAPAAFQDDDEANPMQDGPMVSHAQLAAAVAARTEVALSAIRTDLQLRAELVQQIETCKQEYLFMRGRYEERISLLQENMKVVQAERDQAIQKGLPGHLSGESRVGLNRAARQKYEDRIRVLGKEANELKDRLRTALHTTNSKSSANDCLVRNLRAALSSSKSECTRLQSQLSEQLGRLRTDSSAQLQELADLRQALRKAQEASTKWRRAHEFQKALLQKRIEQCLHARAKIRQLVQLLRRHRVNLASPSTGIDWGSPGWKALQAEHPSPLLPARLTSTTSMKSNGGKETPGPGADDEVPMCSPVRRFPVSQLGQKSISAHDLSDDDVELAEATSQLVIESDPSLPTSPFLDSPKPSTATSPVFKPSLFQRSLLVPPSLPVLPPPSSEMPKSILRASPLLPRRRDFFGRLAEAAAAILSPSKAPPSKKPNA